MSLKAFLLEEDRGVSPVIGVILMVAITVILAAVIATFVMNMGPPEDQAPTASWSIEDQSDRVIVEHDGGGSVVAGELKLKVETSGSDGGTIAFDGDTNTMNTSSTTLYNSDTKLSATDGFEIVGSGNSVNANGVVLNSDAASDITKIELVWESEQADKSQTLKEWEP